MDKSAEAAMRREIDRLQAQLHVLQSPVSETERDALKKAQHRADSVSAMFGQSVSSPRLGETSIAYRKRLAADLQKYSPQFKDARLDAVDHPTLTAMEDRIYADAVATARSGNVPRGQLREVKERDASGRLISRYYGDPMAWMGAFMGQGHSGRLNQKPNGDR